MHKRFLPACLPTGMVLFAIIIFSCSKPSSENTSADSTAFEEVPANEDPTNDTAYDGNMDGDYFVPADSTEAELGEEPKEMIDLLEPTIDVCGFSEDGKYFAFTQVVQGQASDGQGKVFVIDAAKNEWASKPAFVDGVYEDLDSGVARKRDSMISKYKIRYHKNIGKEFNLHDKHTVTINGTTYEVLLQVTNLLIDLRVKGNGKEIVLQKDKSLPKSRGSVREYRLNKAYVFSDKIAVFVEYDGDINEGFEGYRYFERKNIAVTAIVK